MRILLSSKGFSILEILISLAIISVFILQVSAFTVKYKHHELESIANEISSAVHFAKFFAIIRGENLTLQCKNTNDCSLGLELFSLSSKTKDTIIKQWNWHNNKIYWHGFNTNNYLIFTPDIKHNTANGKFKIFYKDELFITLIVNRIGNVRIIKEF